MDFTFDQDIRAYVEERVMSMPIAADGEILDGAIDLLRSTGRLEAINQDNIVEIRRQLGVEVGMIRLQHAARSLRGSTK